MLSGYMGKSDAFDEAIAAFSMAYADQNEKDHAALERAVRKGKVKAVFEAGGVAPCAASACLSGGEPVEVNMKTTAAVLLSVLGLGAGAAAQEQAPARPVRAGPHRSRPRRSRPRRSGTVVRRDGRGAADEGPLRPGP